MCCCGATLLWRTAIVEVRAMVSCAAARGIE
jgi:hypothetical protein